MTGITLSDEGRIRLSFQAVSCYLGLEFRGSGEWMRVPLSEGPAGWRARTSLFEARLTLDDGPRGLDYRLEVKGDEQRVVRIYLESEAFSAAYPLVPGVIHGDNSLIHDVRHVYPHLSKNGPEPSCATEWGFRADRCSYPISMVIGTDWVAGISVDPYSQASAEQKGGSLPSGVHARLQAHGKSALCGVSLGYVNAPKTYLCQDRFEEPVEEGARMGTITGRITVRAIRSRLEVHDVIKDEYNRLHPFRKLVNGPPPQGWDDRDRAIKALCWGLSVPGWDEQRQVISNPNWNWETKAFEHSAAFGFHEIAWTAGAPCAVPLLRAGLMTGNALAAQRACLVLDRIAESIHPDSGLFHDAVDKQGQPVPGWWAYFNLVPDDHYAYLNGQAAFYLLEAAAITGAPAAQRSLWKEAACAVLRHVQAYMIEDGSLPWSLSRKDGKPVDYDGFASCWFTAALARAAQLTESRPFLKAAIKSFSRYREDVHRIHCYGTPLDTSKAVDEEGILAYIKAAKVLHQVTGESFYLEELRNGINYELLWRYGYNAYPLAEPLASAPWGSAGGSITSVANPHTHPMGLMIAGEAAYLLEHAPDSYQKDRLSEHIRWALVTLSLTPEYTGFGFYGTLTERHCPSDGLLIETYPDGSPSSCWFTHHSWGCANILEGLMDVSEVPSFEDPDPSPVATA